MVIGCSDTAGDVDTGWGHVVTVADLKHAFLGIVRRIVFTSETVVNVLAEALLVLAGGITYLQTEGVAAHEAKRNKLEDGKAN